MPRTNRTKRPPPRRRRKAASATATPSPTPPAGPDPDETTDADGQYGRVEVRLRVMDLLGRGYSPALVVEQIMQQPDEDNPHRGGFAVSRATGWRYVKFVREQWEKQEPEERTFQRARCIRMQEYGIRGAAEDREWAAFNAGVKNLADLLGIRVSKHEVTTNDFQQLIDAIRATPAQRLGEMQDLEKLAADAGINLKELVGDTTPADGPSGDPRADR